MIKTYMKKLLVLLLSIVFSVAATAQADLIVRLADIRLVYDEGTTFDTASGYHLYIRKKPEIESVLLTETTKDPSGENDNYAYRASEYNPINGDEIRYLNGQQLQSEYARYSLIDSTAESDEEFGEAFHIYIPAEMVFGYPWTRNGTVKIGRGTFINIRAFEKKYADYTGAFADNPFMFDLGTPVAKAPPPPPPPIEEEPVVEEEVAPPEEPEPPKEEEVPVLTDDYNPLAAATFKDIAGLNGGQMIYSKGPETIVDDLMESIMRIDPKNKVDVVFAIDATGSMKDDVQKLRNEWLPRLTEAIKQFGNIRLGLLLYRDYGDTYKYMDLPVKKFDFTDNIKRFMTNLNSFVIFGKEGGDIPEAVYEALYASVKFYPWRKDATKKVILVGDAEPHPTPRGTGKYTKELVTETAQSAGVIIDTIIVPDNKKDRGR